MITLVLLLACALTILSRAPRRHPRLVTSFARSSNHAIFCVSSANFDTVKIFLDVSHLRPYGIFTV
jgi:hypothetical protein